MLGDAKNTVFGTCSVVVSVHDMLHPELVMDSIGSPKKAKSVLEDSEKSFLRFGRHNQIMDEIKMILGPNSMASIEIEYQ